MKLTNHTCDYCGAPYVNLVEADGFWSGKHWQCEMCDSTFGIDIYDEETDDEDK